MCMCGFENASIKIKKLYENAKVPSKREEDSGYDIFGMIEQDYLIISPGRNAIIGTGISMEFPKGLGFIVGNRGSVGTKGAIVGAHVIDSGYRGEVKIDLHNISDRTIIITDLKVEEVKERLLSFIENGKEEILNSIFCFPPTIIPKSSALTQGMIIPTLHLPVEVVDELSSSERGSGAFGSTNKKG